MATETTVDCSRTFLWPFLLHLKDDITYDGVTAEQGVLIGWGETLPLQALIT